MPSPFQSAVLALIAAEREVHKGERAADAWNPEPPPALLDQIDRAEQALAQAGDALESELRKMVREEAQAARIPLGGW